MRYWISALLTAMLAAAPGGGARAQTAIVTGNCNVTIQEQELNVGAGATVNNTYDVDCGGRKEAEIRVQYVWLDALTASLAMGGVFSGNLKQIVGERPRLLRLGAYDEMERTIRRLGTRFGGTGEAARESGFFANERLLSARSGEFASGEGGPSAAEWAETPQLEQWSMPWPAARALSDFYGRSAVPEGFRRTYDEVREGARRYLADVFPDEAMDDDYALSCLRIYDFLQRDEFERYWDDVDALTSGPLSRYQAVSYGLPRDGRAEHPGLKAIRHFTRENWPEDFIFRIGGYEVLTCGGPEGMQFQVHQRELFLLVAVVEVTEGALAADRLELGVDRRSILRTRSEADERETARLSFPRMERGESFILPLRIELRYDLGGWPFALAVDRRRAEDNRADLMDMIRARGIREIDGVGGGQNFPFRDVRMPVSVFGPPEITEITRTYIFGPSYELLAIGEGERAFPVRKLPASAWMTVAGLGIGSCPWLMTTDAEGREVSHDRVLIGAVGRDGAMTETRRIEPGTRDLSLVEREPEIAMIREVAFRAAGGEEFVALA